MHKAVRLYVFNPPLPSQGADGVKVIADILEGPYTKAGNIPPSLLDYMSTCVKKGQLVELQEVQYA